MKLNVDQEPVRFGLASRDFDHPVLDALPGDIRGVVCELATRMALSEDDRPPTGHLYFLTSGVLGLFPENNPVCTGVIGPGSVHGWEALLDRGSFDGIRAILSCQGFSVPLPAMRSLLGDNWIFRFLAAHAVARTRTIGVEAACNARHTASQRTAKWILRLHDFARDPTGIPITQARLADLLGFQRTSINASCGYLRDRGAIRIRRGRLIVSDIQALKQIACTCDAGLAYSENERRRRRLAN